MTGIVTSEQRAQNREIELRTMLQQVSVALVRLSAIERDLTAKHQELRSICQTLLESISRHTKP